ncbi:MAG TPA: hypothetical protein VFQ30_07480 [Ktedonobacteraceae bacterium]|nr:hypothetical protein [Ktedonobacteraceae bacterium]
MVPAELTNFFLGSVGAAAALIGLLFVAISITPEDTVFEGAPLERQGVASSTFSALANAFFISIAGLIPTANIGYTTLVMGLLGLSNSLNVGWHLLRGRQSWQEFVRRMVLVLIGVVLYGFELYYAWQLLRSPNDSTNVLNLSTILLGIYGVALIRAWELLGARRFAFSNWFNPLASNDQFLSKGRKDTANTEAETLNVAIDPEPVNERPASPSVEEKQQTQK